MLVTKIIDARIPFTILVMSFGVMAWSVPLLILTAIDIITEFLCHGISAKFILYVNGLIVVLTYFVFTLIIFLRFVRANRMLKFITFHEDCITITTADRKQVYLWDDIVCILKPSSNPLFQKDIEIVFNDGSNICLPTCIKCLNVLIDELNVSLSKSFEPSQN